MASNNSTQERVTSLESELADVTGQIEEYRRKINRLNSENSALEYYLKNDNRGDIAMANDLNNADGRTRSAEDGYDLVYQAVVNDQEYNSKGIPLETRFIARIDANNTKAARLEQELNSSGLLERQASLSSELEQARSEVESEPIPVDDVPPINSNFYTKQLEMYEINYQDAMARLDNMVDKFTTLYDSFAGSSGNNIDKIRSDLTSLITDINSVKTKIANARKKTFDRAASCNRCYNNWKNNDTYTDVGIDESDGRVYGNVYVPDDHEYRDPNILEIILGISTARAEGLGSYEYHKATIEEMFNS